MSRLASEKFFFIGAKRDRLFQGSAPFIRLLGSFQVLISRLSLFPVHRKTSGRFGAVHQQDRGPPLAPGRPRLPGVPGDGRRPPEVQPDLRVVRQERHEADQQSGRQHFHHDPQDGGD